MSGYCIHLQREFVNKPNDKAICQRLSYDLSKQTKESIYEMHQVLREFSNRSNGEFKYWITDYSYMTEHDPSLDNKNGIIYSSDLDKNERHTEDICALHSGESETDPERPAEGVQE